MKKRGRPRKYIKEDSTTNMDKKIERPKKSTLEEKTTRRRGRPRKY